jgi:hypothetical protein
VAGPREGWRTGRLRTAVYDFGVRTYPINAVGARLLWGYDVRRLWKAIGELGDSRSMTVSDPSRSRDMGARTQ